MRVAPSPSRRNERTHAVAGLTVRHLAHLVLLAQTYPGREPIGLHARGLTIDDLRDEIRRRETGGDR